MAEARLNVHELLERRRSVAQAEIAAAESKLAKWQKELHRVDAAIALVEEMKEVGDA